VVCTDSEIASEAGRRSYEWVVQFSVITSLSATDFSTKDDWAAFVKSSLSTQLFSLTASNDLGNTVLTVAYVRVTIPDRERPTAAPVLQPAPAPALPSSELAITFIEIEAVAGNKASSTAADVLAVAVASAFNMPLDIVHDMSLVSDKKKLFNFQMDGNIQHRRTLSRNWFW